MINIIKKIVNYILLYSCIFIPPLFPLLYTMSNENKSVNYSHFDDNQSKEKYCDGYNVHPVSTQYKELYTNTTTKNNTETIIGQHFVKDLTKPFTYHSISNETYHNLNQIHSHDESDCDYYPHDKSSVEDDGCVKIYFCGLIGCCLLCMFGCKHF